MAATWRTNKWALLFVISIAYPIHGPATPFPISSLDQGFAPRCLTLQQSFLLSGNDRWRISSKRTIIFVLFSDLRWAATTRSVNFLKMLAGCAMGFSRTISTTIYVLKPYRATVGYRMYRESVVLENAMEGYPTIRRFETYISLRRNS